jgi:UDP-N-acetylglucosamine 2-epimerase (non-hydrolysing)
LLTTLPSGEKHLREEHLPEERIRPVGNTMIDTLKANLDAAHALEAWLEYGLDPGAYMLVTLHRPSLVDDPEQLGRALDALDEIARKLPVVFPMHPRTKKNLAEVPTRVVVTEPLPYRQFLSLEAEAAAVLTDSGGLQEETTVLGVPCFTLRANTERPETLEGTNRMVSMEQLRHVPDLLDEPTPGRIPGGWDGHAGERAAEAIESAL